MIRHDLVFSSLFLPLLAPIVKLFLEGVITKLLLDKGIVASGFIPDISFISEVH